MGNGIQNQYIIEKTIYIGDFYSIYKARDKFLGRWVAIKVIHPWKMAGKKEMELMLAEAKEKASHISTFRHRNIMTIYSANMESEIKYLVLEYIDGLNLKEIIQMIGPLPINEVQKILIDIAKALSYGHRRKLIHQFINTGNVMVDDEFRATISPFKIIDVSRFLGNWTDENAMNWSPEQLSYIKASAKSDQYSLGLLAFELITGYALFEETGYSKIMEKKKKY